MLHWLRGGMDAPVLHCNVMYCMPLSTTLYCTALHCVTPYCTILHQIPEITGINQSSKLNLLHVNPKHYSRRKSNAKRLTPSMTQGKSKPSRNIYIYIYIYIYIILYTCMHTKINMHAHMYDYIMYLV